jgi:hypothetical protein
MMGGADFAGLPYAAQNTPSGVVPSVDQRRWQTCPVCFGKGLVANGFYSAPGQPTWPSTSTGPEKCRSCGGRGIVR